MFSITNRLKFWAASLAVLALLLAACSSQTPAGSAPEPAASEPQSEEVMDESPDEAMSDEDMDEDMMEEETHDDTMMDDEMAAESSDEEMMDDESHDDSMMDGEMSDEPSAEEMSDEEMMDEEAADGEMMSETAVWQTIPLTNVANGESYTLADFKGKTVYVEPMATWCTNCRRQLQNVQQAINTLGDQEEIVFIALSLETNLGDGDLANYAANEGFSMVFSVMSEELLTALVDEFGRSAANAPSTPHFVIRPDGTFTELSTGFEDPAEVIEFINSNSG